MTTLPNQGTFPPDPKPEQSYTGDSSGLPPSVVHGASQRVAAVATGSLPVSSAESLLEKWDSIAKIYCGWPKDSATYKEGVVYKVCAYELRREMARAAERQPEENKADMPK